MAGSSLSLSVLHGTKVGAGKEKRHRRGTGEERMAGFSVRSERAVSGKGAGELELCKQRPEGMAPAWHGVPCSAVQASALWDGLSLCSKETVPREQGSRGPAASSGLCWIRSCPLALCEAPNVFCIVSFRSLKCYLFGLCSGTVSFLVPP